MARRFSHLVVRFRFVVLAAWIAAALAATAFLPGLSEAGESPLGGLVASDARAIAVEERSLAHFRVPLLSRTAVVQRDRAGLTIDEQRRVFDRALRINQRRDPLLQTILFALPITNTAALLPGSRELGTTAVTYLFYEPDASLNARDALAHSYAARIVADGDAHTGVTGPVSARLEQWRRIEDALPRVELATVLLIAVILGATFRAPGAPLVALGGAAVAYLVAARVVAQAGRTFDVAVPAEVEPVMVVLLLGLVTDYTVFFLAGVRRRLADGEDAADAVRSAMQRYVPIIGVAGLIVALGTAALLVGRLEFFRAFGPGAALSVLVASAASLTFVPAALATFGRHVFRPGRRAAAGGDEERPGEWRERLARRLTSRRVAFVVAVVTAGALTVVATGVRELELGFTLITGLHGESEVARAADAAAAGFAPGILWPTEVLVEGEGVGRDREALVRLQRRLEDVPDVAAVIGPANLPRGIGSEIFVARDRRAARFVVVLDEHPLSAPAIAAVDALERTLPALLRTSGVRGSAALAGDTALAAETVASVRADVGRISAAALVVNFLVLAVFLRALVAPLYLLASSALALVASLACAAFFFQNVLGHTDVTYYVPFAAAVLLLAFGSDYNLLIVGRVWQEARIRPLAGAIAHAAPRAGAAISVAGVTLAGSFALLALVPLQPFREFALVMCVGILLDTFVVRPLLVPSLLALVGDASWWPGHRRQRSLNDR